jgi:hypothetical protein
MTRYNNYVVREFVEDECGCGTYRESTYRVPEEDCGCQEEVGTGDRVRLRYDRFGNAWIVGADELDCGCVDTDFGGRVARGPLYDPLNPYRGVYLAKREEKQPEKQAEKQGGACTE